MPTRSSTTCTGWASSRTRPSTSRAASSSMRSAVAKLKQAGVLYACYETPEELDLRRKVRRTRGLPPVYGREALQLTDAQKAEYEADGRKPHWRFLLPNFRNDPQETGAHRSIVDRHRARRGDDRSRLPVRSDPDPRGRHLSLHAAVGGRRHRDGHQPCHPRRRPRHQHRRADRAVQGAWRRATGVRAPQSAHSPRPARRCRSASARLSIASLRESGLEPMSVASLGCAHRHVGECGGRAVHAGRLPRALRLRCGLEVGGEIRSRTI